MLTFRPNFMYKVCHKGDRSFFRPFYIALCYLPPSILPTNCLLPCFYVTKHAVRHQRTQSPPMSRPTTRATEIDIHPMLCVYIMTDDVNQHTVKYMLFLSAISKSARCKVQCQCAIALIPDWNEEPTAAHHRTKERNHRIPPSVVSDDK